MSWQCVIVPVGRFLALLLQFNTRSGDGSRSHNSRNGSDTTLRGNKLMNVEIRKYFK